MVPGWGTTHEDDATVTDSTNENGDCENDDCDEMGWELDELVDDAMEFDEARGGLSDANDTNNTEIEMWDAGDNDNGDYDYMNGEEEDEEGKPVCSDSVDGPRASVSCVRSQMDKTLKARECPGRKRRIVKVTQWSASARANMVKALRERVT